MPAATVPVAAAPSAVAVTPDGTEVYVAASGGVLQVLETALIGTTADPVTATLSFGASGGSGTSIAISPDGARVYAVVSGSLHVIDTATHAVLGSLYVGASPDHVTVSSDGSRAYVTNAFGYDTFGFDGQVVVVDTVTGSVLTALTLYGLPASIAVTPDGSRAYVAIVARFWNTGYGMGFLPESTIAVIDLVTNTVGGFILLPGTPAGIAVTPDGNATYVAIPATSSIGVIDTATDSLISEIDVAAGPSGVAIGPAQILGGCEEDAACDDGNPCTDDTCDPSSGCHHTPNTAPCDDGNPCTASETCDGHGACVGLACDVGATCGQLCGSPLTCTGTGGDCRCEMP